MADIKQIEQELLDFLNLEANMRREDRIQYLMAIVNKHFEFEKTPHIVNYGDVYDIINSAKGMYTAVQLPMKISRKELDSSQANYVIIMEAVISHLNSKKLLKRMINVDYTKK